MEETGVFPLATVGGHNGLVGGATPWSRLNWHCDIARTSVRSASRLSGSGRDPAYVSSGASLGWWWGERGLRHRYCTSGRSSDQLSLVGWSASAALRTCEGQWSTWWYPGLVYRKCAASVVSSGWLPRTLADLLAPALASAGDGVGGPVACSTYRFGGAVVGWRLRAGLPASAGGLVASALDIYFSFGRG